ncbi:MAG: uncharacterized protein PWQ57_2204 [Desulfovibrionales bacterium]|jgi:Fe-S-cluster containining protein|nr:uncharacterized protein [Desulfovibrionales bacterium]
MCGVCCQGEGGIVVSSRDVQRLVDHLEISPEAFEAQYIVRRSGKRRLSSGENGACVFYVEGRGCGVHPGRPDVCRAWPYFKGNLLDKQSFFMARDDCPGLEPDAEFDRFVEEGVEYLRREGLWGNGDSDAPNALFSDLDEMLDRIRGRKSRG